MRFPVMYGLVCVLLGFGWIAVWVAYQSGYEKGMLETKEKLRDREEELEKKERAHREDIERFWAKPVR